MKSFFCYTIWIHFVFLLFACGNKPIPKYAGHFSKIAFPPANLVNELSITYRYEKLQLSPYCRCIDDEFLSNVDDCDTTILQNGALLYWHFNCDSSWLTLEKNHKKMVLNSIREMHDYTYRLGFQLEKEFKTTMLFRYGCPANGPCMHALLNKETGKVVEEFEELIFNAEDTKADFVIYFDSNNLTSVILQYINTGRKHKINIPSKWFKNFHDPPIEQQFDKGRLEGQIYIQPLQYKEDEDQKNWLYDSLVIDLNKYPQ